MTIHIFGFYRASVINKLTRYNARANTRLNRKSEKAQMSCDFLLPSSSSFHLLCTSLANRMRVPAQTNLIPFYLFI